jgi:hypothetical protein
MSDLPPIFAHEPDRAPRPDQGGRGSRLSQRSIDHAFAAMLEGGLEQAVRAFTATPASPGVTALARAAQDAFFPRVRREMNPPLKEGKVIGKMPSTIIVGTC